MCATLGHNHPDVLEAMQKAMASVMHLYSGMLSPPVVELCRELAGMLPPSLSKVLLLNTGAESNEAALRMAKLHTGGFEIVGFSASWHGMTAGAMSSTYSGGRRGYGPTLPGTLTLPTPYCYRCPVERRLVDCDLNCLDMGFDLVDRQSVGAYAAALVEPILSAGGLIELPEGYLARLKSKCAERNMLLILDEAQTALGRVGTSFAFEQQAAVPDILTLSKTLGAGLPLAATVTGPEIEADCHAKGFLFYTSHVSDPLPAQIGLAVLQVLSRDKLAEKAIEMGGRLKAGLEDLQKRYECVGDVRGRGLLLGVELVRDRESRAPAPELAAQVSRKCLELGLLFGVVQLGLGGIFRIAPPLTVSAEEIDSGLSIFDQALAECSGTPAA
jgi:2,2-dialkylglycine decarboxylase (pyruvate)